MQDISTDLQKIVAICEWPEPQKQKEVQQFLSLTNFYSKFIAGYADIVAPLIDLTGSHSEWVWTETEQYSFDRLKTALLDAPVLARLDHTENASFAVESDTSNVMIGSVLS